MGCLRLEYIEQGLKADFTLFLEGGQQKDNRTSKKGFNYYPFGMVMPGRNTSTGESYRYAYNGMEQDNEVSGNGNSYTTEFRQYDPRLGRWKSLDPLMAQFAPWSPYNAYEDNPIYYVDPKGLSANGPDDPPSGLTIFLTNAFDWSPGIGSLKGIWEGITGKQMGTGQKLETWERWLGVVPFVKGISNVNKLRKAKNAAKTTATVRKVEKSLNVYDITVTAKKNSQALIWIQEGRAFERMKLAELKASGVKAEGGLTLALDNGKGAVKGNYTKADALVDNGDGTYSIIEYKRSYKSSLSKGQSKAKSNVGDNGGTFEVRSNNDELGLKKGDKIKVTSYERVDKIEKD